MRKDISRQRRLDCAAIGAVPLNLECRHELVPLLKALQHLYSRPELRARVLELIAQDVNQESRADRGREGFDYWQVLVLAAVRLGCNLDYDQLQDLAEQHRALRQIMGVGDWSDDTSFDWRRIRDNVCHLRPSTIDAISDALVAEGHRLAPDAPKKVRADSFVAETNIHWPNESSLIRDGVRKIISLCLTLRATPETRRWSSNKRVSYKSGWGGRSNRRRSTAAFTRPKIKSNWRRSSLIRVCRNRARSKPPHKPRRPAQSAARLLSFAIWATDRRLDWPPYRAS